MDNDRGRMVSVSYKYDIEEMFQVVEKNNKTLFWILVRPEANTLMSLYTSKYKIQIKGRMKIYLCKRKILQIYILRCSSLSV